MIKVHALTNTAQLMYSSQIDNTDKFRLFCISCSSGNDSEGETKSEPMSCPKQVSATNYIRKVPYKSKSRPELVRWVDVIILIGGLHLTCLMASLHTCMYVHCCIKVRFILAVTEALISIFAAS